MTKHKRCGDGKCRICKKLRGKEGVKYNLDMRKITKGAKLPDEHVEFVDQEDDDKEDA